MHLFIHIHVIMKTCLVHAKSGCTCNSTANNEIFTIKSIHNTYACTNTLLAVLSYLTPLHTCLKIVGYSGIYVGVRTFLKMYMQLSILGLI